MPGKGLVELWNERFEGAANSRKEVAIWGAPGVNFKATKPVS